MNHMKRNVKKIGFVAALALLAWVSHVQAQVTVSNENLLLNLEDGTGDNSFPTGSVYATTVDGFTYLSQSRFWLRMTDDTQEYIPLLSAFSTPATNVLTAVYTNEFVSLTSTWTLTGGPAGSYTSLVTQVISISNLSLTATSGVFYALFDFDVSSLSSSDNILSSVGASGFRDSASADPWLNLLFSNSAAANEWEARTPGDMANSLDDTNVTALANAITGSFGPGETGDDFAIAYGWSFSLNPNDTFNLTMTWETIIPEPSSWVALLGASVLFAFLRRRAAARR